MVRRACALGGEELGVGESPAAFGFDEEVEPAAQALWHGTVPAGAARAVSDATARFHNPTHAPEWSDPRIDTAYAGVRQLVLRGLEPSVPRSRSSWRRA